VETALPKKIMPKQRVEIVTRSNLGDHDPAAVY